MKKNILKLGKRTVTIALSMFVLAGAICPAITAKAAAHAYAADEVLYESNYDGAKRPADSWEGGHFAYASDLYPAADPDDDANTVLMYTQCRTGLGLALLGHDYKTKDPSGRTVKVQAGVAYKVEFKLYTKGETGLSSTLDIGLAVGAESHPQDENITNGTGKINESNYGAYLDPIVQLDSFREYAALEEGWKEYTGYITIPEDADVSEKNALYIYCKGGSSTAYSYIDDVKVTALAGVDVDYVVDGKTVSVYYADGIIPSELPEGVAAEDEEGNSLKLCTDADYKTLFSAETYERSGKDEKVTLYGTYKDVKADTKADSNKKDDTAAADKTDKKDDASSSSSSIFTNPVFWIVIAVVVVAAVVIVIVVAKGKKKEQ